MRSWPGAQFAFLGIPTLLVGRRATDFIRTRQPRGMRDGRRDPSGQIRSSLVQLATPDAMRGRVSAVNMLFIGASGELGAFEAGVAASMFGTVESVVLGGIGTLLVVAVWMATFPALRNADRVLHSNQHRPESVI